RGEERARLVEKTGPEWALFHFVTMLRPKSRAAMIRLEQINKSYRTAEAPLHVLRDVSFRVERGELVSIMGSSGSGKSTLLNILGILDDYDTGSYFLGDRL